jgi:hypothetical protein
MASLGASTVFSVLYWNLLGKQLKQLKEKFQGRKLTHLDVVERHPAFERYDVHGVLGSIRPLPPLQLQLQ